MGLILSIFEKGFSKVMTAVTRRVIFSLCKILQKCLWILYDFMGYSNSLWDELKLKQELPIRRHMHRSDESL